MDDLHYKIRVKKADFEVEVQGDKQWVEEKFRELSEGVHMTPEESVEKVEQIPETLVELLEQKGNPQKHTELVTVFAFWLLKAKKIESFNAKDIVSCYDRTRRVKPKNTNQIINANVRSNLFAEANEKKDGYKAWFVTHTGEEFVENLK